MTAPLRIRPALRSEDSASRLNALRRFFHEHYANGEPLAGVQSAGGRMTEPFGVALIGCGTVGSGVARLLLEHPERLAARAGRPLELRRVVVRDLDKARPVNIPRELLTTDLETVIRDPQVQVVAELVGGIDW